MRSHICTYYIYIYTLSICIYIYIRYVYIADSVGVMCRDYGVGALPAAVTVRPHCALRSCHNAVSQGGRRDLGPETTAGAAASASSGSTAGIPADKEAKEQDDSKGMKESKPESKGKKEKQESKGKAKEKQEKKSKDKEKSKKEKPDTTEKASQKRGLDDAKGVPKSKQPRRS